MLSRLDEAFASPADSGGPLSRNGSGRPGRMSTVACARRLLAPVRHEIVALAQQLVRTDTVAVPPDGNERAGQRVLAHFLRKAGLDVERYETAPLLRRSKHAYVRRERRYEGRPNVLARLPGTGRGRSLLLNGHMDTVPAGELAWRRDPWCGSLSGGRLYGRGAWDMKGGLAAQFGVLLALQRGGVRLAGDVLAESVVDEEWAGGGGTLAGRLRGDRADAAVIAEGTNLSVLRATRGGHFVEITATAGDPSKYFSSDEVLSPAFPLGRLLGWVEGWNAVRRRIRRGQAYAAFAHPAPVQVLAVEANRFDPGVPWAVPLTARVRLYFQFLPHEDVAAVLGQIRRSLKEFCRRDAFFREHPPEWRDVVYPPLVGHELPARHEWTRCLHGQAIACLGEAPLSAAPYPCDAFLLQREFGIPTLLFGPSGGGAHNPDEYVTVKSVIQTAQVLLASALEWCGG